VRKRNVAPRPGAIAICPHCLEPVFKGSLFVSPSAEFDEAGMHRAVKVTVKITMRCLSCLTLLCDEIEQASVSAD